MRCHSFSPTNANTTAPPRNVLIMGQLKSYTVGNNNSLDATTVAKALTSLNQDHWFEHKVSYFVSLLS